MRRLALLACALILSASPSIAGDENDGPITQFEFQTPSGNIGCVFTPEGFEGVYKTPDGLAELSCDRREPSYVRVILGANGKPKKLTSVGDVGCCSGVVLEYGQRWDGGPFTCVSKQSGLTCKRGKRGFTLSRKAGKTF